MEKLEAFKTLAKLFNSYGYRLYLVGGAVRDFLLDKPILDIDVTSDATPKDIEGFLPNADYTFSSFGSVKIKYEGATFELTTLREECSYIDSRHPNKINFVKDINIDYKRRDFTINAIYMDEDLNVIDPANGEKDLQNRIIKMIGDPDVRLNEDPLRILRAIRFSLDYGFRIDKELKQSLIKNASLLEKLNPQKIREEISKIHSLKQAVDYHDLIKLIH